MHSTQSQGRPVVPSAARNNHSDVEIVLFDGFSLSKVAEIIEIFQRANALAQARSGGEALYNLTLLSATGGTVVSSSEVGVWTEKTCLHRATSATILLFIAGGAGARQATWDERLLDWVRQRYAMSAIVCPVQEGKLILDAIGLAGRYRTPAPVSGNVRHIHLENQRRTTASATRTALQIVKDDLGAHMAKQMLQPAASTRETAVTTSARTSSQPRVSDKIMASARWLDANVDRPISIELAAEVAAMSERNFLRRFKAEMGMTPSDYLQRARLELSCRMLVESQLPVDKIARRCGVGSGGQLAKLFRKHLSITPTDYRLSKIDGEKGAVCSAYFEAADTSVSDALDTFALMGRRGAVQAFQMDDTLVRPGIGKAPNAG